MLGDDDAFAFQFVIGTLDGDDAYLKVDGKLACSAQLMFSISAVANFDLDASILNA